MEETRCSPSRRPGACIRSGSASWISGFPGRCGCSHRQTTAARTQLGSRRFKTDDRDCAVLTSLARQGQGGLVADRIEDALAAAVRHRRAWSPNAESLSNGCTTSSTPSARGYLHR